MFNVKKLKKKHWMLSMGALLLITGVSTSTAVWASNHTVKVEAHATEAVPVPSTDGSSEIVAPPNKVGISEAVTAPSTSETPEIVALPEDEVSEAVPVPSVTVPSTTVPSTTEPSEAKVVESATVPFTGESPEMVALPGDKVSVTVPAPSEK